MRVETEAGCAALALLLLRCDVLEVRHANLAALRIKRDRCREPANGYQAEQFGFARFKLKDSHGILCAVTDKQVFSGPVKSERVRLRPEQIRRILPSANRLDHLVAAGIDHTQ